MKIIRKKLGIAVNEYEVEMSDDERRELIRLLDFAVDEYDDGDADGSVDKWRRMRRELVVES